MILITDLAKVLKEFKDWGWAANGSLENTLVLEKFPVDSRLSARLIAKKLGDGNYKILGWLRSEESGMKINGVTEIEGAPIVEYTSHGRLVSGVRSIVKENGVLREIGNAIAGKFELYFGFSNNPRHIEVYEQNKIT